MRPLFPARAALHWEGLRRMENGQGDRFAWRRFETKYVVTAAQAAELSQFCRRYLEPDRFAARAPQGTYPILSVYLDSPRRDLLRHTLEKRLHRFKLRIRTYRPPQFTSGVPGPAFLEIKRKDEGVSHKFRACVQEVDPFLLMRADFEAPDWIGALSPEEQRYAAEFCALSAALQAEPAVAVFYRREAYETTWGGRVRITLDRDLQAGIIEPGTGRARSWWPVLREPRLVVEIKYDNACPFWLAELLRRMQVVGRASSKYVRCIQIADRMRGPAALLRVVG